MTPRWGIGDGKVNTRCNKEGGGGGGGGGGTLLCDLSLIQNEEVIPTANKRRLTAKWRQST